MDPTVLIAEATSKLKKESSWITRWMFNDYDSIAELYFKAGNLFKLKKQWEEAIDAYIKAHYCYIKDNSPFQANKCNIEIAKCSRHNNIKQCKKYTTKVINYFANNGDFYNAGTYQEKLAIIWHEEHCFDTAIREFEKAIEYYDACEKQSPSMRCKLQVADISSIQGYYNKALTIFKSLATECQEGGSMKFFSRRYFLKAGIVSILISDTISTRRLLEEFNNIDYSFVNSSEQEFLLKLIKAYEDFDVESFTSAVADFDHFNKLDNWYVTLLLQIKSKILENDTEDSLL